MDKNIKNLTIKQTRAIQSLLAGQSVTEAADAAKVRRSTLYTWLEQPGFTRAINEGKSEMLERLSQSLASLSDQAVNTLARCMSDPSSAIQLRAADIVISRILSLKDSVDFERRIAHLENTIENRQR